MRTFTFDLSARYPDGAVTPLKGNVAAPVSDGADFTSVPSIVR